MKPILATAITLATISSAAFHPQTAAQRSDSSVTAKHETPFACNRLALSPEHRKRHFDELGPALRSLGMGVHELPDGFEFKFPADVKTYQLLAEWTAGERLCCPFFDIDLRSEREGGPVWLRLTGRDGVKPFIAADFVKWFRP
jgi:hypothetical protein